MTDQQPPRRYAAEHLREFATTLLARGGLAHDRAATVAEVFLEADLLGFRTHGLNRVPSNLDWLRKGETRAEGEPRVVVDREALFHWDAELLPGPYVVTRALAEASARVPRCGVVSAVLRRCQHIACLAAYLPRLAERGLVAQIVASTPDDHVVSPFGGVAPVFSANPFAFCAPTETTPVLIDISLSIVAEGQVARARDSGTRMPSACLKDHLGNTSDDPMVYWHDPKGSIMPIGGTDHGYKGAALSLWSELMTMALANFGRLDSHGGSEANSVFIQVIDPAAFGSGAGFRAEAEHLAHLLRASPVRAGDEPVRVPGDRAFALRRAQLTHGVELSDVIVARLAPWAEELGIPMPEPLAAAR